MTALIDLFKVKEYATDKLSRHSYLPVYEELFSKRRESVLNVLEIGIGSGGSLELWHDYFINANIYGIDPNYYIDRLNKFERITQLKDDAYDEEFIQKNFVKNNISFDIIIDDGPHNKDSQVNAMKLYFPLLSKNGLIIIEDVQDYLDPGTWIRDIIKGLPTQHQRYARIIDLRHYGKSPDDLLIILDLCEDV